MSEEIGYYNTTKLKDEELQEAIANAKGQDKILLKHFQSNPDQIYFASTLWINLFETEFVPLTSIRRSIHTLFKRGLIERILDEDGEPLKAKCPLYGKKVFQYKLNPSCHEVSN